MANKSNNNSKISNSLSDIANLVTLATFAITYFTVKQALVYVTSLLVLVTLVRNYIVNCKLKKMKLDFEISNDELHNKLDLSENKNQSLENKIEQIHNDLISGKSPSDILINYYIFEVDNQFVNIEKISIDAFIQYEKKAKLYGVIYSWEIKGSNPSLDKPLSKLSFIISGDSVINDNNELNLKIEMLNANNTWQEIRGYVNGSDKIKYINIDLKNYAILPNRSFQIRFSYIWPRSYVADGGDVFSFGSNTFSSTKPYEMCINVHADKLCFSAARMTLRTKINEFECKEDLSELQVIEMNSENIITVTLPPIQTDRACYITTRQ